MAYTPTVFVNVPLDAEPDPGTPDIDAGELNKIGAGIAAVDGRVTELEDGTTGAVAAHVAEENPHPQYLDQGEGDDRYLLESERTTFANAATTTTALATKATTTALALKVAKGELVFNVKDYGAVGDGTTNDTTAINAALAAAPVGATVLFPQPSAFYLISDALLVRAAGLTIRGSSRSVEVRQQTWLKPAFDVLDADDVTVESLVLTYSGATRTMGGSSFRGSNPYVFSAGVWTNAHRTTVQDVRVKRFVCGVHLSAWDTGTSAFAKGKLNNRVLNVECDEVDFGVLYLGQDTMEIGSLYTHDHLDASGGANPTHAIYGSGTNNTTLPSSEDAVIHDLRCVNNLTGAAFQTKYANGGTLTNLVAENCAGVINVQDIYDTVISNVAGRNMVMAAAATAAMTFGYVTNNARCNVSNVHITMGSPGRALTLIGDDMRYSNINVVSAQDASNSEYLTHFRGSRSLVDGLTVVETGSTPVKPLLIGWPSGAATADSTVRGLSVRGTQGIAEVAAAATGTVIQYAPAMQKAIAGTTYITGTGGATWTQVRAECTRTTVLSGGSLTLTPNLALETVSVADVQSTSAITVAAPASTPQVGMQHTVAVANNSGSAMGNITWNAVYDLSGSFLTPPTGTTYQVVFMYDGSTWREVGRSLAAKADPVTPPVYVPFLSTYGESVGAAMSVGSASTSVVTANGAIVVRVVPRHDMAIAVLTWISVAGSGNYDLGILDSTGAKLWSKGSTAWSYGASAVVDETVSPAVTLTAGEFYYIIFSADNTTGTFRGNASAASLGRLLDGAYVSRSGTSLFPIPSSVTLGSLSAVGRIPVVILREA